MKTQKIVWQTLTILVLSLSILNFGVCSANSATIRVPEDQPSIQAGIDASVDGDTVLVADGTHTGNGNRDLDFKGKAIKVQSENGPKSCVIDCTNSSMGFYFHNGESQQSVLSGFTIKNGVGRSLGRDWAGTTPIVGGAIFCDGASPTIKDNIFENNSAELGGAIACFDCVDIVIKNNSILSNQATEYHGGGIYLNDSSGNIEDNFISENIADSAGGGICTQSGSAPTIQRKVINENKANGGGGICIANGRPQIRNNIISQNESLGSRNGPYVFDGGGALRLWGASILATNNNFIGNKAILRGGAIYAAYTDGAICANNIFWDNQASSGDNIYLAYYESSTEYPSKMTVKYSDLQGGETYNIIENGCSLAFENNIEEEPLFVNALVGDYRLLAGSPCIDTGTAYDAPNHDIDGNHRPFGAGHDIGAYEYQGAVSTSTTTTSTTTSTTTTTSSSSTTTSTLVSAPNVTTNEADADPESATLYGTVNPNGSLTHYYFEYGPTSEYGYDTPIKMSGSGTTDISVKAHIEGLKANTLYHYKLFAYNGAGMSEGDDKTFITTEAVLEDSKVIIVAGGGPYPENNIWESVEKVSACAYVALIKQGYKEDLIHYLSPNTLHDPNGDNIPDVDADATALNLEYAIKTWAQDVKQVVIYLVGHGGVQKFKIGQNEEVGAQSLDSWLDEIQDGLTEQVVVIYDACHAGSFLPLMAAPVGKERIVAASTASAQSALISAEGHLSFSYLFWNAMRNGDSFYNSFVATKNALSVAYPARQ